VLTAEAVENAVWDAARVGHTGDGTYGKTSEWAGSIDSQQIRDAMKLAPSAGDPAAGSVDVLIAERAIPGDAMALTTGERTNIAAAVWNALTSAMTTVGSIGKLLAEKVALIVSGSSITVSSPVLSNGSVETIQGDDYLYEDGRALEWTVSSTAILTGGVATVVIKGVASFTAVIVSETLVRLELTKTQSAAINAGYHGYSLFVTQTDGDKITLARGTWHSSAAHTA